MTDGIIREVFKRYYSRKFPDGFNDRIFYQIQQELIEKIKEEIPTYGEPLSREIIYKILIGDNQ